MTHPQTHATPSDPAQDADRLGDAWDALVAGHRPTVAEEDAELMAVVGQLSTKAQPIRPTLTFRNSLRETLMHAGTIPITAALPAPTFHPMPKLGRPVEIGEPIRPSAASLPGRIRITGMRWAAVAATIALLLTTAGGGYLATRGPSADGSTRVAGFAASPEATPAIASQSPGEANDPCAAVGPQGACGGPGQVVAQGLLAGSLYADAVTDGVTEVEMSTWSINPGQRAVFPAWTNLPTGVGLDIVVEGVYVATFAGPVIVARFGPGGTGFDYPATGDLVELIPGDSVSYAAGTRSEIANPLATQTLEFKSLEFFSTVILPGTAPDPASGQAIQGSYEMTLDGAGALPQPLDASMNREVMIYLTFSSNGMSATYPEDVAREIVIGPVDANITPGEVNGTYTVWAYQLSS